MNNINNDTNYWSQFKYIYGYSKNARKTFILKSNQLSERKQKIDNSIEVTQIFSVYFFCFVCSPNRWEKRLEIKLKLQTNSAGRSDGNGNGHGKRHEQIKLLIVFSVNITNMNAVSKKEKKKRILNSKEINGPLLKDTAKLPRRLSTFLICGYIALR